MAARDPRRPGPHPRRGLRAARREPRRGGPRARGGPAGHDAGRPALPRRRPGRPGEVLGAVGAPRLVGAQQPDLARVFADTRRPPWLPTALVVVALAAAATSGWQGRARRWSWAAGAAAGTALGLVAVAVVGDGYFEIFKHVWLAAYLLAVAGSCLAGAVAVGAVDLVRRRRRPAA